MNKRHFQNSAPVHASTPEILASDWSVSSVSDWPLSISGSSSELDILERKKNIKKCFENFEKKKWKQMKQNLKTFVFLKDTSGLKTDVNFENWIFWILNLGKIWISEILKNWTLTFYVKTGMRENYKNKVDLSLFI